MDWSMFLCLGSIMSALVGLVILAWAGRQGRWRFLWVLVAAVFLIGAGFGAAEAVYQLAVEREEATGTAGDGNFKAACLWAGNPRQH